MSPSAFGINKGKKRIAVIRAGGPILAGGGSGSGGQIKADTVIKQLRAVEKDKVSRLMCGLSSTHTAGWIAPQATPWRATDFAPDPITN